MRAQSVQWASQSGARNWTSAAAGRRKAKEFHASMPGYRPTPLAGLPELATELGVRAVLLKDESDRLGLPAFKILGASWAVNCALSQHSGFDAPAKSLIELRERSAPATLVTATDGNHGRAVARMAALLGLAARIYVPAGTAEETVEAITSEGAKVVQTDLIYDEVVWAAASSTAGHPDDLLVQDTAWEGYEDIPQWIVGGYGTLFDEIAEQLGDQTVHLVAVPTGVGSLLQAALQHYRAPALRQRPAVLAVEPVTAACVAASLAAGRPVRVDTSEPTIMAGLNCGSVSSIAWPAIRDGLDAAVAVTDDQASAAMHRLNELGVAAGPCGGAGLAGVRSALDHTDRRAGLAISEDSVVVLISTDGAV
ncbi:MAG TPA: diaminopropionate ammonia-lyase [Propionibacteriaceae bacterium]|nr:diaminopropionate ammonia-lyase [Propionibacteriaceae bacterium]